MVKESGIFRNKGVGVYAGSDLIHAGTPPQYVPELISELFAWLRETELHPLIKSCIFHYEFEFIHPFADGNGRTGRMWRTLILAKWKEFFLWLPIETLIHERQEEYYQAINAANTAGESTVFVEFMLAIIKDTLEELFENENRTEECTASLEEKVLNILEKNGKISTRKIAERLKVSERQVQRIVKGLKEKGILERVGASRNGYWRIIR